MSYLKRAMSTICATLSVLLPSLAHPQGIPRSGSLTMQADPPLITPAPDAVLVARILMRQADEAVICGYVDGSSSMFLLI